MPTRHDRHETSLKGEIGNAFETTFGILKDIITLFSLEFRLVKKNLITLLITFSLLLLFLITGWLCLTWLLIQWLMGLQFSAIAAIFIGFVINITFATGLLIVFLLYKKKINFSATKSQIENLLENHHD